MSALLAPSAKRREKPTQETNPKRKPKPVAVARARKPKPAFAGNVHRDRDSLGEMQHAAARIEQERPAPKAAEVPKLRGSGGSAKGKPRPVSRRPPRPKAKRPPRQKPKAKARSARGPPTGPAGQKKGDAGRDVQGPTSGTEEQAILDPPVVASLTPRLAAAAQDILDAAAEQKTGMRAAAAHERQSVRERAADKAQSLVGEAKAKAQATGAALDGKKVTTAAGFEAKAGQIAAQIGEKQAAVRQHGKASLDAIDATVEEQKAALMAKANARATALVQDGDAEATGVLESGKAAATKVSASKKAQIAKYQGDKDAASKVRDAVNEAAGPVVSSLQSNSDKGAGTAREGAAKKAAAIREEAVKTAAGLGDKKGDVQKAVADATAKTVAAISAMGTSRITGIRSMKDRALASFADMKGRVTSEILSAGERSASMALRGGEAAAKAITSSEKSALPAVDRAASQALSSLTGIAGRRRAGKEKVATFTGAVRGKFGEVKQQFGGAVNGQSVAATAELMTAAGATAPQLQNMSTVSMAAADRAQTSAWTGADAAVTDVRQNTTHAVNEGNAAGQKAVGQFSSSLDTAVAKADQEWAKDGDKTLSEIRAGADKAATRSDDVAVKADSDLASVAANVAADAHRSLFGQIVSGIWEGIKNFAIGIGKLLLVAGLVFLVAAALSLVAFTAAGFLTVLAVVAIVFLAVALVEAIDQRAKEIASVLPGDAPWWVIGLAGVAVVGVAIGDVIGISPIIEGVWGENIMTGEKLTPEQRSERITAGILQIVTLFLFHAIAKRVGEVKGGGEKPRNGEKPPIDVVDPYAALGKKYGLRPDILELLRKSKIDTKLFDRILSRGVDPETVALMADVHGLAGVRILDVLSSARVSTADIVKLVEGAESLGKLKELAEATDKGLVGKLFRRGFQPDEINVLLDDLGSTGLGTIDGMMEMGVDKRISIDTANIAKRIGAEAEVNKIARDGNLRNANGFRRFLKLVETEVEQGKHGLLNELKEAAERSRPPSGTGDDGVALGKEGAHEADVIDFGRREALQMKTVTGKAAALADNVNKAAQQLRGETGEMPPPGFAKVIKIIVESGEAADLGRRPLLEAMKENGVTQKSLTDVSRVEVRNNKGTFTYSPSEF